MSDCFTCITSSHSDKGRHGRQVWFPKAYFNLLNPGTSRVSVPHVWYNDDETLHTFAWRIFLTQPFHVVYKSLNVNEKCQKEWQCIVIPGWHINRRKSCECINASPPGCSSFCSVPSPLWFGCYFDQCANFLCSRPRSRLRHISLLVSPACRCTL